MRRLILLAIALVVLAVPAVASAKAQPIAGSFQLAATSDHSLKGNEVSFVIKWYHGRKYTPYRPVANGVNGWVVKTIPQIHAGDVFVVEIYPHSKSYGTKMRSQRYKITKTEAQSGVVKEISLPHVDLGPQLPIAGF